MQGGVLFLWVGVFAYVSVRGVRQLERARAYDTCVEAIFTGQ